MEIKKLRKKKIPKISEQIKWSPEDLLPPNMTYPSVSSALTQEYSPTKGRCFRAKNDIHQGDVLFVEKPFASVELGYHIDNILCAHCYSLIIESSYPCRGCPHVAYCSQKCWSDSWLSCHKWECVGYEMGIWMDLNALRLAIRMLYSSIETFDNVKFNEVQKLLTNFDQLEKSRIEMFSIVAMMLLLYLEVYTDLFNTIDLKKCLADKFADDKYKISCDLSCYENKRKFVSALLLRYLLQNHANGYEITPLNIPTATSDFILTDMGPKVASGIYMTSSLINHSCVPNAHRVFWNDYIIIKAIQDIPAGEGVLISYGPVMRGMEWKQRQEMLKKHYYFDCQCEACTDPELRYFWERYFALKCLKCNGALVQIDTNSLKCLDCNSIGADEFENRTKNLKYAESLFCSGKDFRLKKIYDKALDALKSCLSIRQKWLFKYHSDIHKAYDEIATVFINMRRWEQCIPYIENAFLLLEAKWGPYSYNVITALHLRAFINIMLLKEMNNKKSPKYRDIIKKTDLLCQRTKKIINMYEGPWSDNYQVILDKERELSNLR